MFDAGAAILVLFFTLVVIAGFAFWIWTLVDAIRVPDDSLYQSGSKVVWVLVIVLAGVIGSIIYLAIGRPEGGASAALARWGGGGRPPGPLPPPPPPPP
jgi:Phospholipase_D-nuclease N-terminal